MGSSRTPDRKAAKAPPPSARNDAYRRAYFGDPPSLASASRNATPHPSELTRSAHTPSSPSGSDAPAPRPKRNALSTSHVSGTLPDAPPQPARYAARSSSQTLKDDPTVAAADTTAPSTKTRTTIDMPPVSNPGSLARAQETTTHPQTIRVVPPESGSGRGLIQSKPKPRPGSTQALVATRDDVGAGSWVAQQDRKHGSGQSYAHALRSNTPLSRSSSDRSYAPRVAVAPADAVWEDIPSQPPHVRHESEATLLGEGSPDLKATKSGWFWSSPSSHTLSDGVMEKHMSYDSGEFHEGAALFGDAPPPRKSWMKRHPWLLVLLLVLLLLIGAGLGAGLGIGLSQARKTAASHDAPHHDPKPGNNSSPLDSSGNDPTKITPLPVWDWSDPASKAYGVSLGNWLVHERWLDEDWWTAHAPDAQDEWTFHATLGNNVTGVLEEYMRTFLNESDVQILHDAGVNMVRIPVAYWFWVPTQGKEPYRNGTHLDHLTQMMGWLWKRGMRAVIDMHQLMGSQSGDPASGQATAHPHWWNATNQARSDELVHALVDWLAPHPYRSVVAAITPVNEPNGPLGATPAHLNTTRSFYDRTYATLSQANLTMFFHHGFAPNPAKYWRDFALGKDPRLLVFNDNPYPGDYPSKSAASDIYAAMCSNAGSYKNFPVPTVKTEWSLTSGISGRNSTWSQEYFSSQASAYGWSGGSFFWTYKAMNSSSPTGTPAAWQVQWSFVTQLQLGNVPRFPANHTTQQFFTSLPDQACGPDPNLTWTNPAS